ncbi:MAG: (d)CMP kinase [Candidatus Obscuribacter sp.]|jgi:cytidylate kinase|nr:(d)CMP kinase [Candidatus Obscuribacter sp.]MDQ5967925.1 Cytidylate kinase [Cyanobacteriota bacterium erpe_2018_sw_39hr_WHONDRS-SW48-000098_B_bin.30]MBK9619627.1 (d)CMP kinase [Candidatus Obscuribacter sp.]MBP6351109.1 (d)CMP kinase [Candidatus Obscuribacter sp.]MBP6594586.1 (d)CMP kinase [Candidatus Obscuribacter sp.]
MSAKTRTLQIAIDGPAGAGKSTVARQLADKLGYLYIDTGAMYRATTWLALQHGLSLNDGPGIAKLAASTSIVLKPADATSDGKIRVFVGDSEVTHEIRTQKMSEQTIPVAALKEVRQVLVEKQKELADKGSAVLDGRDIGTVVLPQAKLKIFLTASPEVRARRRLKELSGQGEHPAFEELLAAIKDRDHKDRTREVSPLTMADDAIELNTDELTIEQVVAELLSLSVKTQASQA